MALHAPMRSAQPVWAQSSPNIGLTHTPLGCSGRSRLYTHSELFRSPAVATGSLGGSGRWQV